MNLMDCDQTTKIRDPFSLARSPFKRAPRYENQKLGTRLRVPNPRHWVSDAGSRLQIPGDATCRVSAILCPFGASFRPSSLFPCILTTIYLSFVSYAVHRCSLLTTRFVRPSFSIFHYSFLVFDSSFIFSASCFRNDFRRVRSESGKSINFTPIYSISFPSSLMICATLQSASITSPV